MSDVKKTAKLVKCVVCHCMVPTTSVVESYADIVCTVCDGEMVERDQELYEQDMETEIHRLWGNGR